MVSAPEVRTLSVTLCSLGPREEAPSMSMRLQGEDEAETEPSGGLEQGQSRPNSHAALPSRRLWYGCSRHSRSGAGWQGREGVSFCLISAFSSGL